MLEDRLGSLAKIERELDDAGDARRTRRNGRRSRRPKNEGVAPLKALKAEGERRQLEALLSGEADGNDTYLEVHSGAGGTESCDWARMLLRMYVRWARAAEVRRRSDRGDGGRRGRHQVGDDRGQGPQRPWLAEDRIGRAPAGAHLAVRLERPAAHELRLGLGLSGGRRPHPDRHQRERLPDRHLPRLGRRRPARQQDRIGGAHHPYSDRHRRRLPDRSARSTRTARPPGTCCAPGSTSASWRSARPRRRPTPPPRPTSAGATRSAPTCCSPTRWSRTCAPATSPARPSRRARRRSRRLHGSLARAALSGRTVDGRGRGVGLGEKAPVAAVADRGGAPSERSCNAALLFDARRPSAGGLEF